MPLLLVVGAALVRDGQVLAARRSRPADLAGGWDFPGGKVEADEDERGALARELHEELGVRTRVGLRLGEVTDGRIRLVLYAADLVAGEPAARADHDELRWLPSSGLPAVAWLPIDRQLLPLVAGLLERGGQG